ncbi:MAG: deoxyribonuclease IV [Elusimicrobia bacterium]|nr:deoxyribonuclease IV [Elusimicrobiota bacterium]
MMRVGVHTSVRKGFAAAAEDAAALGCETLQLFTQSPRGWMTRVYDDAEFVEFRRARERLGLHPVVVHTPYLPNLCTSDETLYQRSLRALKDDLLRCAQLGAEYLVIHPGAFSPEATLETGLQRIAAALDGALAGAPGGVKILIENMAGGGRRIGGRFEEIASLFSRVKQEKRLGVCFDTCHAFAAGYDLRTREAVLRSLAAFDKTVGLSRIEVFHVNDCKGLLEGHRDLHEHIGKGQIGEAGFKAIFETPAFAGAALILETPKEPQPAADLENLRRLRAVLPRPSAREVA